MLVLRPAEPRDGDALGRMGAALARMHHDFDPARFMLPDGLEEGYRWWLLRELDNPKAVIVVAEDEAVVGYAYGRREGKDWNSLLDEHGELVDVWVDEAARRTGAGAKLVEDVVARLAALGVPRVVLSSASPNLAAQRLFAKLGFRPTMVEMTRETGVVPKKKRRRR